MDAVQDNIPLWDFIGFLLYFGVFTLGQKEAVRTAKIDDMDKAWKHMSLLANATNKTNYAVYGMMMDMILHDTHAWPRALMDHDRTFRETDKPCTGRPKGTIVERVSS